MMLDLVWGVVAHIHIDEQHLELEDDEHECQVVCLGEAPIERTKDRVGKRAAIGSHQNPINHSADSLEGPADEEALVGAGDFVSPLPPEKRDESENDNLLHLFDPELDLKRSLLGAFGKA